MSTSNWIIFKGQVYRREDGVVHMTLTYQWFDNQAWGGRNHIGQATLMFQSGSFTELRFEVAPPNIITDRSTFVSAIKTHP